MTKTTLLTTEKPEPLAKGSRVLYRMDGADHPATVEYFTQGLVHIRFDNGKWMRVTRGYLLPILAETRPAAQPEVDARTRYFVEILEDLRYPAEADRWFRPWVEGFESADEARTAVAERLDYPGTKRRLVVETTTTEVIETL